MQRLKLTTRTKTNNYQKWGISKYLSVKILKNVKRLKFPWGKRLRLTQMRLKIDFVQILINDLCKQVEKTQGQIAGTKKSSFVGNDQNTLLYDFMQKFKRLKK